MESWQWQAKHFAGIQRALPHPLNTSVTILLTISSTYVAQSPLMDRKREKTGPVQILNTPKNQSCEMYLECCMKTMAEAHMGSHAQCTPGSPPKQQACSPLLYELSRTPRRQAMRAESLSANQHSLCFRSPDACQDPTGSTGPCSLISYDACPIFVVILSLDLHFDSVTCCPDN